MSSTTSAALPTDTNSDGTGTAQASTGISLVAFLTALATSLVIFAVQIIAFLLLRNKLARILYVFPYVLSIVLSSCASLTSCHPVNQKHSSCPNANEQNHHRAVHGAWSLRL